MSPEERNRIIKALEEKLARLPCPRCGNNNFSLLDGYFNLSFQPQLSNNLIIGGPSVPAIAVVCNRCGFLSNHAIGALGLMPEQPPVQQNQTTNVQEQTQTPTE